MLARTILASTGTIVGRANNYGTHLVTEILPALIDEKLIAGGELMMLNAYYERLTAVATEWTAAGIPFPVIHCEKDVGTLISDAGAFYAAGNVDEAETAHSRALELFRLNCEMGALVRSSRMVIHLWGGLNSDRYISSNIEILSELCNIIRPYGIRLLIENVPSALTDPLINWKKLLPYCPEIGFVFDTRFGNLHRQIDATLSDGAIVPYIEHIHISDHRGAERDFSSLRPILHPGEGMIDFDSIAQKLNEIGYESTVTLESPVIKEGGADGEKLRRTLIYLNRLLLS